MNNKESLGNGAAGAVFDMSDMPDSPIGMEEAGRSENINNDPSENAEVMSYLGEAKERMIGQLEDEAMKTAFNRMGNPSASTLEVAQNADMTEAVQAEVCMSAALDSAEMRAAATGMSVCDALRKHRDLYQKRLESAEGQRNVQKAAWNSAVKWDNFLLDQMKGYRSAASASNALPGDVL